jgi:hypothetical protein
MMCVEHPESINAYCFPSAGDRAFIHRLYPELTLSSVLRLSRASSPSLMYRPHLDEDAPKAIVVIEPADDSPIDRSVMGAGSCQ